MKKTFNLLLIFTSVLTAQENYEYLKNWHHKSFEKDSVHGLNTEEGYQYLKNKKGHSVIVAVLDSGVDVLHEDLAANVWVNEDEISNNGIDDDNNGYIDDINGWNFLGNKRGENIYYAQVETTRIYHKLHPKFKDIDSLNVRKKDRKEYKLYLEVKASLEAEIENAKATLLQYQQIKDAVQEIESLLGSKEYTAHNLDALIISSNNPFTTSLRTQFSESLSKGTNKSKSIKALKISIDNQLASGIKTQQETLDYLYNPNYNSHKIITNNFDSSKIQYYGNNDYLGDTKDWHANHVAGIIGGIRNNNIGIDGISSHVKIMTVKMIEEGDEHDKDVANAIRYAIANGAKVINISFGKEYSLYKKEVDKAIRYAKRKDVLIVQGSGNSGKEITKNNNFPNAYNSKGKKIYDNWITVGAISHSSNTSLVPDFTNYSKKYVDVFAPGVSIYSLGFNNSYEYATGTSQAAPMVVGVAALLFSYFPDLTSKEVKDIILKSSIKINNEVHLPGSESLTDFKNLCESGGIVNLYRAVILADKMSRY